MTDWITDEMVDAVLNSPHEPDISRSGCCACGHVEPDTAEGWGRLARHVTREALAAAFSADKIALERYACFDRDGHIVATTAWGDMAQRHVSTGRAARYARVLIAEVE